MRSHERCLVYHGNSSPPSARRASRTKNGRAGRIPRPARAPAPRMLAQLLLQLGGDVLEHSALAGERARLQFGVDFVAAHGDLKGAPTRGYQGDLTDAVLVGIQQLARQTGGSWKIPSRGAVADLDPLAHNLSSCLLGCAHDAAIISSSAEEHNASVPIGWPWGEA